VDATDLLLGELRQGMAEVLADSSVVVAYLFGSQAAGRTHPESDIDVGILADVPDESARLKLELRLEVELAKRFPGRDFDVRVINHAPLPVRGKVVQAGKLLFCRDDKRRIAFETLTRKLYFDFRPTLEGHQAAYLRRHLSPSGSEGG